MQLPCSMGHLGPAVFLGAARGRDNTMKKFGILVSAMVVFSAGTGLAGAQNFYFGGLGGASIPHDSDTTISGLPGITINVASDVGYVVGGFVGYDFAGGFRLEGELVYRRNGLDEQSALGISFPLQGDVATLSLMANGLYEFGAGNSAFVPRIGAGIGMARFSLIDAGVVGSPTEDNDDTVFAYQLIAGVGYELSPTLTLFADYRLFGTTNPEFTDSSGNAVETEYLASAILVGISSDF